MPGTMAAHVFGLTAAQRRVLLAMPADRPFDAWARCWHVATLYVLEARGLIEQGHHGWLDATLTDEGRALRRELEHAPAYREAAE